MSLGLVYTKDIITRHPEIRDSVLTIGRSTDEDTAKRSLNFLMTGNHNFEESIKALEIMARIATATNSSSPVLYAAKAFNLILTSESQSKKSDLDLTGKYMLKLATSGRGNAIVPLANAIEELDIDIMHILMISRTCGGPEGLVYATSPLQTVSLSRIIGGYVKNNLQGDQREGAKVKIAEIAASTASEEAPFSVITALLEGRMSKSALHVGLVLETFSEIAFNTRSEEAVAASAQAYKALFSAPGQSRMTSAVDALKVLLEFSGRFPGEVATVADEMVALRAAGVGPKAIVQRMQEILLLQDKEKIQARLREITYGPVARP